MINVTIWKILISPETFIVSAWFVSPKGLFQWYSISRMKSISEKSGVINLYEECSPYPLQCCYQNTPPLTLISLQNFILISNILPKCVHILIRPSSPRKHEHAKLVASVQWKVWIIWWEVTKYYLWTVGFEHTPHGLRI